MNLLLIATGLIIISMWYHETHSLSVAQPQYLWPSLFLQPSTVTTRQEMQALYSKDCIKLSQHNASALRTDKASALRIATFNVLSFQGVPIGNKDKQLIARHIIEDVLTRVAPDIIIFEEVGFPPSPLFDLLEKAGYSKHVGINNIDVPCPSMICVKKGLPATFSSTTYHENFQYNRGYVRAEIAPSSITKNRRVIIYGTHLDVYDETEKIREAQITELLIAAQKDTTSGALVIMAGDLNAVNLEDYRDNETMLNELVKHRTAYLTATKRASLDYAIPPQNVFKALEQAQFIDVFSFAQLPSPRWTTWSGTRVDWILLPTATKNLKVHPGVYYPVAQDTTVLSDHILVFADLEFQ